jgi:hypothetical protein
MIVWVSMIVHYNNLKRHLKYIYYFMDNPILILEVPIIILVLFITVWVSLIKHYNNIKMHLKYIYHFMDNRTLI